jgi:hypothetical protein
MYPRCNDGTLVLPPRLFGSTAYYAVMALYGSAVIDTTMHFDKRAKLTHRYSIADANGPVDLTVPIEKPETATGATWRDIRISRHGQWWHVHLTALQSAYGRTPFFEYYIDDFLPLFTSECAGKPLMEYLAAADAILRRQLHITTAIAHSPAATILDCPIVDLRRRPEELEQMAVPVPYYQLRSARYGGFRPYLSILDLLFNLGPEAPAILYSMCN